MRIRIGIGTSALVALLGLAAAEGTALAQRGPEVRDHRKPKAPDYPTQPPPAAQAENVQPRQGYVWIAGHYEWRNGGYAWVGGHWERTQKGKRWRDGRWERQNDRYVWVAGAWDALPDYPTDAPPPPRAEQPGARNGYVWVTGHYEWRNYEWAWVAGHWERTQKGKRWRDGRWERRGDRYVWVDGAWDALPDYPTEAPPPPRAEQQPSKNGYVWIAGRYEWRDYEWVWVAGHWEREQQGRRWRDGRWERRGDRYVWVDGTWEQVQGTVVVNAHPAEAPPPPPQKKVKHKKPKKGHVWVEGHYDWRGNQWVWIEGHWERERKGKRWRDGRWERRGDHYEWNDGSWD